MYSVVVRKGFRDNPSTFLSSPVQGSVLHWPPPSYRWLLAAKAHRAICLPLERVGKCQLRTTALYPHDNKNSQQTPEHIENHIIQFAKEVRMVLALGGGAVMQAECEEMVHSGTLCIYLRASVDTLVERLTGEDSGRPLLSGADPGRSSKPSVLSGGPSVMSSNPTVMSNEVETSALRTRILELMRQRSETYERVAHLIVDTDGKSVGEIAEEITRFHV